MLQNPFYYPPNENIFPNHLKSDSFFLTFACDAMSIFLRWIYKAFWFWLEGQALAYTLLS